MTPLAYANELLKSFEDFAANNCDKPLDLPEMRYAQVGAQVVGCESLIVASTGADAREMGGLECDFLQVGTFVVTLAHECAIEFTDDGFDDPVEVARVSEQMDRDGECLWEWALSVESFMEKDFSLGFDITGGLAITSLQLTLGVG